MKIFTKALILAGSLMIGQIAFSQPANDLCSNATNLGTLPAPAACNGTGPQAGSTVTLPGQTTANATSDGPYYTGLGCFQAGAAPRDVWYTFVASGTEANIAVRNASFLNPYVVLWSGGCGNLSALKCTVGDADTASLLYVGLVPGLTYYIQVAGVDSTQQGTFALYVHNDNDCSTCLVSSNLTVNPLPVNGTYSPGQTVTFCFTVTNWYEIAANWFHGMYPVFGAGWDTSTLVPGVPPASCDSQGVWSWYSGDTSIQTGQIFPAGYYYFSAHRDSSGSTSGYSFGDNNFHQCNWQFCMTITARQDISAAGVDLGASFVVTADGQSGSWSSPSCSGDMPVVFHAVSACGVSIGASDSVITPGRIVTMMANGTPAGGTYNWTPSAGISPVTGDSTSAYPTVSTDYCVHFAVGSCAATTCQWIHLVPVYAGPDQHTCLNSTVTMAALDAGTWTALPTNPTATTFVNASDSITTVSGFTQNGVYSYVWTTVNGSDTVNIIVGTSVSLTDVVHNISCHFANDGSICVTASGGVYPYTYAWNPGGMTIPCPTGLAPGTYSVTVADAYGCTATLSETMTQPSSFMVVSIDTIQNISCYGANDGRLCVHVTGGTAPYTQLWSNFDVQPCISGLGGGLYHVIVTDSNGCQAIDSGLITEPAPLVITDSVTNAACNGSSNGGICMLVTGGTAAYNYIWSDFGAGLCRTNMPAGSYSLSVTDAHGCTAVLTDSIRQAVSSNLTFTASNVSCYGDSNGSISVNPGGGGGYVYVWGGSSGAGQTGNLLNGLSAGIYCVTVTDTIGGCTIDSCIEVTEPLPLFVSDVVQNIGCGAGVGSICLNVSGGTPQYTYVWSPPGAAGNCLSNLLAGVYSATVSDMNGCIAFFADSVRVLSTLALIDTVQDVYCNYLNIGSICVGANGGSSAYTYQWSGGSSNTSCLTNLTAGTYTVTVSDGSGCSGTLTDSVVYVPNFGINIVYLQLSCHGDNNGYVDVQINNPGVYHYAWSTSSQDTSALIGLSAGTYCVTVTDSSGCPGSRCVTLYESPTPLTIVLDSVHNASCGGSDGSITIAASGGTPPYGYTWNFLSPSSSPDTTNLAAGAYCFMVYDSFNCGVIHCDTVANTNDCIWPGDADANYLVDNNDLLPIGLGYDSTGTARQSVSIVWQADFGNDWANAFTNYAPAVNFKHADCNGDGTIDANDTLAIMQNFGLTHSKTDGGPAPWRSGLPLIYPLLNKDTVTNGDTLLIDINLGEVSLNATNVYGIAFSLNYDPIVIDTTKTTMTFGNSWLGDSTNKIAIYKDLKSAGVIKAGITRIDHTTRSGHGQIAHLRAIVTTDNIDGKDLRYYTFRCYISDVTAVDAAGNVIDLNEGIDSNQVAYTPLSIPDINELNSQISLYPNPANNRVTVACAKAHIDGAEVMNVLGETVSSYLFADNRNEHVLDLQELSSGIYYIALHTKAGTVTRKLTINH